MKLLIVTPYALPRMGGVERYSYELGMKLRERYQLEVVFVSSRWSRGEDEQFDNGGGAKMYKLPYLLKVSSTPVNPSWHSRLTEIIRDERPDVVNGHIPVPYIADVAARVAQKEGVPFILTYHNDLAGHTLQARLFSGLYKALMGRRTLGLADRVVATSPVYVERSDALRDHRGKIRIVPPGVDTSVFYKMRTGRLQRALGLDEGKVVLFVGRLDKASRHKGLDDLLKAIEMANQSLDVHLAVVGRGDHADHYRDKAKQLGIERKATFLGYVTNEELAQYYSDTDLLVLPSLDRTEGFGMVLIEAQACGAPVIGTNVGGIPCALVDGRTGLLVPPSDVETLSKALLRILGDEGYARLLGQNGIEWVSEEFSWDVVSERFYRTILEVLDK